MELSFIDAKRKIESISDRLLTECKVEFALWLRKFADELVNETCHSNSDAIIGAIQEDLRQLLPLEAVVQSEEILPSYNGPNADCDPQTTIHVDSFVYDDDVIDTLCEEGKMSRSYCSHCGCKQVLPLNFISHSSSKMQLKYIFQCLVPDLSDKIVLDIGSRTGAVLYAAHLYGGANAIVGVEINQEFCHIQQTVIDKYQLNSYIKVIHSDICDQADQLQQAPDTDINFLNDLDTISLNYVNISCILKSIAGVIVMNNVFEFFAPLNVQKRVWQFLRSNIDRPGVVLVTSPSLEQSLCHLQTGISLDSWVQKVDCTDMKTQARNVLEIEEEDMDEIHMYQVLPQLKYS